MLVFDWQDIWLLNEKESMSKWGRNMISLIQALYHCDDELLF